MLGRKEYNQDKSTCSCKKCASSKVIVGLISTEYMLYSEDRANTTGQN